MSSSQPPPDPERLDAALSVYAEYLGALMRGEEGGLAEFAGERPEMQDELLSIHTHVGRIVQREGHRTALFARLAERYGRPVPEPVGLDDPDAEGGGAQMGGRYRVERKIAEGGMGSILRVWDEDLRRHLAMKVVLGSESGAEPGSKRQPTEQQIARFLEEAQVTGQLDHPGIIPVHELGLDAEGGVFFTMRLVRGRELREAMRDATERANGWTPTRIVATLQRVCEAMAYAHSRGVLHRDLKPANIMVGRFGETYVMDWGLARIIGSPDTKDIRLSGEPAGPETEIRSYRKDSGDTDSGLLTMDGDVVGTPAYMSPEQARGELDVMGPAADVYSIGAMLYEQLVGHAPYSPRDERTSGVVIWRRLLAGPPERVLELAHKAPPELAAITERAMERDPGRRYADMSAMAEDLRAYLENRVVRAYRSGALVALEKWIGRNRRLSVVTAALVVLGLSSLVGLSVLQGRQARERSRFLEEQQAIALVSAAPDLHSLDPRVEPEIAGWLDAARRLVERSSAVDEELAELGRAGEVLPPTAGFDDGVLGELRERLATYGARLAEAPDKAEEWLAEGRDPEFEGQILQREVARVEAEIARRTVRGVTASRLGSASEQRTELFARRANLAANLHRLGARPGGWIEAVEARLELLREVGERSLTQAEAEWTRAQEAIRLHPRYDGLELAPQLGLVPLAPDPASGLWEFWHPASGARPQRDNGSWAVHHDTGLVLVLIPGGPSRLGGQAGDPDAVGYDPAARSNVAAPFELEIERPYFLSKYEMTQGQWLRLTGELPARHSAGNQAASSPRIGLAHPIENVSWRAARRVLFDLGLDLPTEILWEHAARGGTTRPTWYAESERDLSANYYDDAAGELGGVDGWPMHSPVDAYRPNPYGLYLVLGGVSELTRDRYMSRSALYLDELGAEYERLPDRYSSRRAHLGAGFRNSAVDLSATRRDWIDPDSTDEAVGLRPYRRVLEDSSFPGPVPPLLEGLNR